MGDNLSTQRCNLTAWKDTLPKNTFCPSFNPHSPLIVSWVVLSFYLNFPRTEAFQVLSYFLLEKKRQVLHSSLICFSPSFVQWDFNSHLIEGHHCQAHLPIIAFIPVNAYFVLNSNFTDNSVALFMKFRQTLGSWVTLDLTSILIPELER